MCFRCQASIPRLWYWTIKKNYRLEARETWRDFEQARGRLCPWFVTCIFYHSTSNLCLINRNLYLVSSADSAVLSGKPHQAAYVTIMTSNMRKFGSVPILHTKEAEPRLNRFKSVSLIDDNPKSQAAQKVHERIQSLQRGEELKRLKRLEKSPERKELGVLMYHMKKKDERYEIWGTLVRLIDW